MPLHNLLGQIEAEAGAGLTITEQRRKLDVFFKNLFAILWCNSTTAVADGNLHRIGMHFCPHLHSAIGRREFVGVNK